MSLCQVFLREIFTGPTQIPLFGSLPSLLYNIGGSIFEKSSFELLGILKKTWGSPIALRLGSFNAGLCLESLLFLF